MLLRLAVAIFLSLVPLSFVLLLWPYLLAQIRAADAEVADLLHAANWVVVLCVIFELAVLPLAWFFGLLFGVGSIQLFHVVVATWWIPVIGAIGPLRLIYWAVRTDKAAVDHALRVGGAIAFALLLAGLFDVPTILADALYQPAHFILSSIFAIGGLLIKLSVMIAPWILVVIIAFAGSHRWGDDWPNSLPGMLILLPILATGVPASFIILVFWQHATPITTSNVLIFVDGIAGEMLVILFAAVPLGLAGKLTAPFLARVPTGGKLETIASGAVQLLIVTYVVGVFCLALLWLGAPHASLIDLMTRLADPPNFPDSPLRLTRIWSQVLSLVAALIQNLTLSKIITGIVFFGSVVQGLEYIYRIVRRLIRSFAARNDKPSNISV